MHRHVRVVVHLSTFGGSYRIPFIPELAEEAAGSPHMCWRTTIRNHDLFNILPVDVHGCSQMFPVDFPHFLVYSTHLRTALIPGAGGSDHGMAADLEMAGEFDDLTHPMFRKKNGICSGNIDILPHKRVQFRGPHSHHPSCPSSISIQAA